MPPYPRFAYTLAWITYRAPSIWGVHVIRWIPKNQQRRWQHSSTYWDCWRCAGRAWRLEWHTTRRRRQSSTTHHDWVVRMVHATHPRKRQERRIP